MTVWYENSLGERITFNDGYMTLDVDALLGYEWTYAATVSPGGYGGRVSGFQRATARKKVLLGARGTEEAFADRMNALFEVAEKDIVAETPGRLWLDDQYMRCYLAVTSQLSDHSRRKHFATKSVTLLSADPVWIRERLFQFRPGSGTSVEGGKRYPNRYPYRYGTGYASHQLTNDHYDPSPFILTIYGPADMPVISVAGNQYGAQVTLAAGERIELNQLARTVVKIGVTGDRTNIFDRRVKVDDPFMPVPAGVSGVTYNGNYGFDIRLLQRRSEPQWT